MSVQANLFGLVVVFSTLLPDDRFTVASRTVEGDSAESEPSVAVRPNEPLPEGWKEKFNAATGKVNLTKIMVASRFGGDPWWVSSKW